MRKKIYLSIIFFISLLYVLAKKNIFSQQDNSEQVLNLAVNTPINFNPLLNQNPDMDKILKLVFEPLIKFQDSKPIYNLIEQINFDKNIANITLKQNIFWSDKTTLTADDVLFSIKQIKSSSQNSIYYLSGQNIISAQKISNHQLKIIFADSNFPSIYLLNFPIIPQKSFLNSTDNINVKNLIFNGPYKITEYKWQKNITLEKNVNYFGTSPEFSKINVLITKDYQTQIQAFNQSLIDIIKTDQKNLGKFKSNANKFFCPTDQIEFIFFNSKNDLFKINQLYDSFTKIIPIEQIRKKNNLAKSLISTEVISYDQDQIKKIFAANINLNLKIKILVNKENPSRINTANLIQKSCSKYNIPCDIEKKDFNNYIKAIEKKDFDVLVAGFLPKQKLSYQKLFGDNNILANQTSLLANDLNLLNQTINYPEFLNIIDKLRQDIKTESKIIILGNTKNIILTSKKLNFAKSDIIGILSY